MMSKLDTLSQHFRQIQMSPESWPLHVFAAIAESEAFAMWPKFPPAATLSQQRLGHGAAEDIATGRTRALGELVEIASCCVWGDETIISARQSDLQHRSFGPAELSGFSMDQISGRDLWNEKLDGVDWIPKPVPAEHLIEWTQAHCLFSGQLILVPADNVLIGRAVTGDQKACAISDTNGCAAGETEDDACLRALFELIERDATGRWWYGQRQAPILDHGSYSINNSIVENLGQRRRRLLLLDITSDLGIPTVAAMAMDVSGGYLGAGFATRANLQHAVGSAVTELMQMELRVAAFQAFRLKDAQLDKWFRDVAQFVPFQIGPETGVAAPSGQDVDLQACIARLKAQNCRVAIMDCTRSEFAVPVVRAISPDLCHWKPRFGRKRLLGSDGAGSIGGVADELNTKILRI